MACLIGRSYVGVVGVCVCVRLGEGDANSGRDPDAHRREVGQIRRGPVAVGSGRRPGGEGCEWDRLELFLTANNLTGRDSED